LPPNAAPPGDGNAAPQSVVHTSPPPASPPPDPATYAARVTPRHTGLWLSVLLALGVFCLAVLYAGHALPGSDHGVAARDTGRWRFFEAFVWACGRRPGGVGERFYVCATFLAAAALYGYLAWLCCLPLRVAPLDPRPWERTADWLLTWRVPGGALAITLCLVVLFGRFLLRPRRRGVAPARLPPPPVAPRAGPKLAGWWLRRGWPTLLLD